MARCMAAAAGPGGEEYSTTKIHAEALDDIERLLPAGSLERTYKGCKADFGFRVGTADDAFLPIQVKAKKVSGKLCRFSSSQRSGAGSIQVLLLGRPFPNQRQTLVLPESMIPQGAFSLSIGSKKASKYHGCLVDDALLDEVLEGIFDGVRAGQSAFTMPSDQVIDISQLQLKPINELSLPSAANYRMAWEFSLLRKQWLPEIDFQRQGTVPPVDVVVQGVRLSDKVASHDKTSRTTVRYRVYLSRSRDVPCGEGDIDALWVYHPNKVHFWLIPAHVLVEKGVMATPQQPGKLSLYLYDQIYVKPLNFPGKEADLWSQEYLYSSQDPGLLGKVLEALKAAKP